MRDKSPCDGCKDRRAEPNCHEDCPHGYKEWAARRRIENDRGRRDGAWKCYRESMFGRRKKGHI